MGKEESSLDKLKADIEILKSESLANTEVRKANNERFTHITEQIGELRSLINHVEKDHQKNEVRVEKVAGLVENVQPQKLMSQLNKTDMKVEALRSLVEANDFLKSRIMKELKDMRKKFMIFRNLETVQSLTDESKGRLKQMKKLEAQVLKEADQVKLISKKFEEIFHKLELASTKTADLEGMQRQLRNGIQENKDALDKKVSKEDFQKSFNKEKQDMERSLKEETAKTSDRIYRDMEKMFHKQQFDMVRKMIAEEIDKVPEISSLRSRLDEVENRLEGTQDLKDDMKHEVSRIVKDIQEIKVGQPDMIRKVIAEEIDKMPSRQAHTEYNPSDEDPRFSSLMDYVKKARGFGLDEPEIRQRLQSHGWPDDLIDKAF